MSKMSKPKFNIIDALIILVVLAVIAAGVYVLSSGMLGTGAASNATAEIQYSVEIKEKGAEYAENIEVGDAVQVGDKEKAAATVESIEVIPTKMISEDKESGVVHYSEIPDTYDVILTLKSNGSHTDTEVYADNTLIRIGEKITVRGKGYSGNGYIIGLEIAE